MKSRPYGRSWYRERLPPWSRGLVLLAVGWALVLCAQQVVDGYGATMDYRRAPLCAETDDGGPCVRRETGTVLDRREGEHCTTSGTGGGTNAGTTGGAGTTTCTPYYDVRVAWRGRTEWLGVAFDTYEEARAGDRAELRLWRDEVVRLDVRGHTRAYPPASQTGVWMWLAAACLLLGVGAWAVVSGRPSGLLSFSGYGWLFIAFGTGWLGSMALFGGHPVVWAFAALWTGFAVFWTVSARRMG
ncbi:hypothetical protein ABZV60_00970 [Streptomyces sp. NPDC004787]|uniref:hypothetical protein n=1 Tax=Streptomyces sp. NPDC004787 TaxID=3154291 RepID=UPI0033AC90DB